MSTIECDGGPYCQAPEHIHGCFAERPMGPVDRAGRLAAENDRLREALTTIASWAEYGYQDLNSGGVLSCVKKRAKEALDG